MAKRKQEETDISDVKVTLKPLFGIKPEYYLPVVYIVLIALVFFFIFLFPGITKYGTYITFKTVPGKTPVYVDDVYMGSTPCTVFVPKGNRVIKLNKPFYKEIVFTEQVKGSLFATLLFPGKKTIVRSCEIADLEGLLQWSMEDIAQFGMLKDFTENYQFPPLISDAVSVVLASKADITPDVHLFLQNTMGFVDSEQELRDFIRGYSIVSGGKKIFSSYSVVNMLKGMLSVKEKQQGFPCWLSDSLSTAKSIQRETDGGTKKISPYGAFVNTDWFNKYFSRYKKSLAPWADAELPVPGEKKTMVRNISCVYVPGTTFIMGDRTGINSTMYPEMENLPHSVKIEPFYMSITEITNKDFNDFVRANVLWQSINADKLAIDGLAIEQYLAHWQDQSPREEDLLKPVTHISYYAAEAYCRWLSSYLPSAFADFEVRLPTEAEWEYTASFVESKINPSLLFTEKSNALGNVGSNKTDPGPIVDLFGSVWEWCDTWFLPREYPLASEDYTHALTTDSFVGSEKAVRGGSWANPKADNIRSFTRGSQPPAWCTPYLGFRIVVAEKNQGAK